jgi:DNA-binding LytR/AlgR family response regulator
MFAHALHHPNVAIRLVQQLAIGFAFWLMFLLILQSGNAARAATVSIGEEAVRIVAASALGSLTALLLVPFSARYPLRGPHWAFHLIGYAAIGGAIAVGLVLLAWVAAPWVLSPDNPRLSAPLAVQLAADAPLLTFAMLGFALLLQLPHPAPEAQPQKAPPEPAAFMVRTRQGLQRVAPAQIDWIEAQENYVALHCGPETHLLRETLTAIAAQLDPAIFVRIHRRTIVQRTRFKALRSLPGGDAMAVLTDGAELRVSRTYAARVREAMGAKPET